ncbi:hypothetical protein [Portibacter marinus]|uniref:hypothetical protein n=1 Tax=Portibacter marinus TaxID=2898660 RepID=UPI001F2501CD|nr:hypothetical protein [Portibacter marinus]
MDKRQPHNYVINYKVLRRSIGILGIALPIVLVLGSFILFECDQIFHSISYYYHTGMRNVLVAILASLAFFLFSYKGPDPIDLIMSRIASFLALIIALFPTKGHQELRTVFTENFDSGMDALMKQFQNCDRVALYDNELTQTIHLIAAALFLLVLAFMSWFLFTRSDPSSPITDQKKKRNVIFRVCAIIILFCVVASGVIFFVFNEWIESATKPIFWLESIALWAFGTSWLIKGDTIFSDP